MTLKLTACSIFSTTDWPFHYCETDTNHKVDKTWRCGTPCCRCDPTDLGSEWGCFVKTNYLKIQEIVIDRWIRTIIKMSVSLETCVHFSWIVARTNHGTALGGWRQHHGSAPKTQRWKKKGRIKKWIMNVLWNWSWALYLSRSGKINDLDQFPFRRSPKRVSISRGLSLASLSTGC